MSLVFNVKWIWHMLYLCVCVCIYIYTHTKKMDSLSKSLEYISTNIHLSLCCICQLNTLSVKCWMEVVEYWFTGDPSNEMAFFFFFWLWHIHRWMLVNQHPWFNVLWGVYDAEIAQKSGSNRSPASEVWEVLYLHF